MQRNIFHEKEIGYFKQEKIPYEFCLTSVTRIGDQEMKKVPQIEYWIFLFHFSKTLCWHFPALVLGITTVTDKHP